jgi:enamine deaminase RidA (YjgF/YER057c/UK114 family)
MMERIDPEGINKPVGSYVNVTRVSAKELIFVAGQIPVDKDGKMVGVVSDGGIGNRSYFDVEAQVRQTMLNVKGALEGVGSSFKDLVRLDTYVVVSVMNEYKRIGVRVKHDMLAGVRVSGATVYVSALQPSEAMIEISAIAAIS